jgi:hypothetical protein
MEQQHTLPESLNLADLRSRRSALNARLSKGLDALRAKEESGDTGPQYREWFAFWGRLLMQYETACDRLTALGAPACDYAPCRAETCAECKTLPQEQALTAELSVPAPPTAWQDKPAQLALFAQASSYGRGI